MPWLVEFETFLQSIFSMIVGSTAFSAHELSGCYLLKKVSQTIHHWSFVFFLVQSEFGLVQFNPNLCRFKSSTLAFGALHIFAA